MKLDFSAPEHKEDANIIAHPHILSSVEHIKKFAFAGNATITLKSKKTGSRFTYRIRKAKPYPDGSEGVVSHFVGVLTGPENENDYQYLGQFYRKSGDYVHGAKSRIGWTAPSEQAFDWFARLLSSNSIHPDLEVWHEGRCGKCNRKLTVPESIASGIGPECAKQIQSAISKQQQGVLQHV